MLFDLTFPRYLTTFRGKKCLSGKVICAFFFSRLSKFSCKQFVSHNCELSCLKSNHESSPTGILFTALSGQAVRQEGGR
jgi:hypothetical protein